MKLAYYISGHGFGHAVRSTVVLQRLAARLPEAKIYLRTTAPRWIFEWGDFAGGLPDNFEIGEASLDAGAIETSVFGIDVPATLERCRRVREERPAAIERETAFLREEGIDLVLSDIPPAASTIAARAGVPSIAIGQFGWDFIFESYAEEYPEAAEYAREMAAMYAETTLLARPPLNEPMGAFPNIAEIPLIARKTDADPIATRCELGMAEDDDRKLVVLLFRHDGASQDALIGLLDSRKYLLATTRNPGFDHDCAIVLDPKWNPRFLNLVAVADVVVSKPGYGIVTDCIANRTPLLHVPRYNFPEVDLLRRGMDGLIPHLRISEDDFLAGRWGDAIDSLTAEAADFAWPEVDIGGADAVVDHAKRLLNSNAP